MALFAMDRDKPANPVPTAAIPAFFIKSLRALLS
jgi:hypothetical protein